MGKHRTQGIASSQPAVDQVSFAMPEPHFWEFLFRK